MKKVLALFIFLLGALFIVPSVSAQYGQYGGPANSYNIIIDKMVGMPGTSDDATLYNYVDNLGVSDPRFKPDQAVFFRIKIKNTSNIKLFDVQAKDYIPSYLDPLGGPGGYDAATRTISWGAGDFEVNEEKTYYIKMKVLPQANLPADQGLFCIVNRAQVWATNTSDDDSSQLCIEKQVTGVAKVPSAGPEFGILLLSGELALLGAGIYLKKRA